MEFGATTPKQQRGHRQSDEQSPAIKRAQMEEPEEPSVDHTERWNTEELHDEVRMLKAQVRSLGASTKSMRDKHNCHVQGVVLTLDAAVEGLMGSVSQG